MEMIPYIPLDEGVSDELLAQIETMFVLVDFSAAVARGDNLLIGEMLAEFEDDLELLEMCLDLAIEHRAWPVVALLIMIIEDQHDLLYEIVFTEDGIEIQEIIDL